MSVTIDQWAAPTLAQFASNKADYDQLYVKTKTFSNLGQSLYNKQQWNEWKLYLSFVPEGITLSL